MKKILVTSATILGLAFAVAPALADNGDGPASDAMATQSPETYDGFVYRPCTKRSSVNCYWDTIGRTGEAGYSYWSIRIGDKACIRYWDSRYNRTHGHCEPIHHRHRDPR